MLEAEIFFFLRSSQRAHQELSDVFLKLNLSPQMSLTPSTSSESNYGRKLKSDEERVGRRPEAKTRARKNTTQCGVWFGVAIKPSQMCVHAWAHTAEWGAMRQLVGGGGSDTLLLLNEASAFRRRGCCRRRSGGARGGGGGVLQNSGLCVYSRCVSSVNDK